MSSKDIIMSRVKLWRVPQLNGSLTKPMNPHVPSFPAWATLRYERSKHAAPKPNLIQLWQQLVSEALRGRQSPRLRVWTRRLLGDAGTHKPEQNTDHISAIVCESCGNPQRTRLIKLESNRLGIDTDNLTDSHLY